MMSASAFTSIQTALAALVGGVAAVGVVHEGRRLSYNWSTFLAQFGDTGKVNGWTVNRRSFTESRLDSFENERQSTFVIAGHYTLAEPEAGKPTSEGEFDAMIESICNAVRDTYTMSSTAELSAPAQLTLKDERMFGDVLVHYCEITVVVQERITV